MRNRPKKFWILIVIAVLAFYLLVLLGGLTESTRRSLELRDETDTADRVFISIVVTGVNPSAQSLTAQLGFRLAGSVAKDEVTPSVDLKLLVNNVGGQQEFDFPKGKRMNRIEAVFPLDGDSNRYPFDRYVTTVRLLMTTPARSVQRQAPKEPGSTPSITDQIDVLAVSTSALQSSTPVALSVSMAASITGIRFKGNVARGNAQEPTGIALNINRANIVIVISLIVMSMMAALSISLLAMVLGATAQRRSDLLPLSVSISLIFGLPALRNIQPGVPPVGALVDYVAFLWAELIVAASAVIIVWTWLLRSRPAP
jgi:hypothetical protein